MIWAQDAQRGIGLQGKMPWHIPEDFAHFKRETNGHTVIMGRTTWDGLPKAAKPLPGRRNIVITHHLHDEIAEEIRKFGAEAVSFKDALLLAQSATQSEGVYIIGGAKVYEEFMPYADQLVITKIDKAHETDTSAPEIPSDFTLKKYSEWRATEHSGNWRVEYYYR